MNNKLSPSIVHCHGTQDSDCHPEGCSHCNYRLQPNELYQWAPEPKHESLSYYIGILKETGRVVLVDGENVTELKKQLEQAGYVTTYDVVHLDTVTLRYLILE